MNCCHFKSCAYSDPAKCKENPSLKLTPCIQCHTVVYCSNNCKIQDWANHKPNCANPHARALSQLNKSDNNISVNTSDLGSSKSSALSSSKTLKDYELVNGSDIKIADLGKGAYGAVKLVKEKSSNKLFALKIVNKKNLVQNAKPEYLKREIKLQKSLDHPHIIKLFHTFEDNENVYLVLEYAKNGSLFFYLRRKKKCEEKEAFIYFFQTCIGIDYLHKKGILHRDIKPENLLLDEKGNIKLCDFGWCADSSTEVRNTFCGTLDYMAPEMLKNQAHDKTVDIWSLGVLLYELLHGYAPFGGISDRDKILKITNYDFKMGEHISPNARDLITRLMRLNPKERLDFDAIFVHPWLKRFEGDFKMDMGRFRYDPEKSRNRSRSRSPNVSEVRVDKPKDLKASPAPVDRAKEHHNRFGKPEEEEDKRQRSNSPISSNYKSNNLGQKDLETSLNTSNISNKMNASSAKPINEKPAHTEKQPNERRVSTLAPSKSYENLQKPVIQNSLLTDRSRENSIDKSLQRSGDRSKSPEGVTRKGIFDKMEPKSPLNKEMRIDEGKKSFKTGVSQEKKEEPMKKNSYRAEKISEIDDSIVKEIEKTKKLEDKLEKRMKINQELYAQMQPFKIPTETKKTEERINTPIPTPKATGILPTSKKTYEPVSLVPDPRNKPQDSGKEVPPQQLRNPDQGRSPSPNPMPMSGPYEKPAERVYEKPMERPQEKPLVERVQERPVVERAQEKPSERPYQRPIERPIERSVERPPAEKSQVKEQPLQPRTEPSPQKLREERPKGNEPGNNRSVSPVGMSSQNNERNRSQSPIATEGKKIASKPEEPRTQEKKPAINPPLNNRPADESPMFRRGEPLAKFGSEKPESKESRLDLRTLNESIIPSDPNYSMQNDSTSEFLMKELSSQKKMTSGKVLSSNKPMSSIKEQKVEEESVPNPKKRAVKSHVMTEEEKRTTHISKFLDGIMQEMRIDEKSDNQILTSLFEITQTGKPKKLKEVNIDRINEEVLNDPKIKPAKRKDLPRPIKEEPRNELTFMEKSLKKENSQSKRRDSGSDDVGNEVSEDEVSHRNTALQRNMDDSIHRGKSQEREKSEDRVQKSQDLKKAKNAGKSTNVVDWYNPEEDSLDDEMDDYFRNLEGKAKAGKAASNRKDEGEFLPKFGVSSASPQKNDLESQLDRKINEKLKMTEEKDEDDEKFKFKSTKKERKRDAKIGGFEENSRKKEVPLSKKPGINEASKGKTKEEPLEIADSDLEKENIVVDEEELNLSLREQGKRKKRDSGSLAEKSNKLAEKMRNFRKEEGIVEEDSGKSEKSEEKAFKAKSKPQSTKEGPNNANPQKPVLKADQSSSPMKVEREQQTSVRVSNLVTEMGQVKGKKGGKKEKAGKSKEKGKDFENDREQAMKQFYDSFALIQEGKFNRANAEGKLFYSFDDKSRQERIEENEKDEMSEGEDTDKEGKSNTKGKKKLKSNDFDDKKLDKLIQSKLDKALLDPHVAKKWLESQNSNKDLDLNFLPKKLANSNFTNYKDSNEKLKRKNDQLKVLMTQLDSDSDDSKRVSRISKRSYIAEGGPNLKSPDEMGFFERLLFSLGCFKRNESKSGVSGSSKESKIKEGKKKRKARK